MSTKALAVGKDRTRKGPVPDLTPEDCPVWCALAVYWAVIEGANAAAIEGIDHLAACTVAREALYAALADETRPLSKYAALEAAEMHQSALGPEFEDILAPIMARYLLQSNATKKLNN